MIRTIGPPLARGVLLGYLVFAAACTTLSGAAAAARPHDTGAPPRAANRGNAVDARACTSTAARDAAPAAFRARTPARQ